MKLLGTYQRYNLLYATPKDKYFYGDMGRFFCNKAIIQELEGPIYSDEFHRWLLVKDGNRVIGFASWTTEKHPVIQFGVIWVEPKYRRQGIARELFAWRSKLCQEQGATTFRALANLTSRHLHLADGWQLKTTRGARWATFEKQLH